MPRRWYYVLGGSACLVLGVFFVMGKNVGGILYEKVNANLPDAHFVSRLHVAEEAQPSTFLVLGDVMLGRSVAGWIQKNGDEYPFEKISLTVSAADVAIANLEGPITARNADPENRMRFHFDPKLADTLKTVGFDAVDLANNHGLDQGVKGEGDTKTELDRVGIKYFGDVSTDDGPVYEFTLGGKKFSMIGLHDVYHKIDPIAVSKKIAELKTTSDAVIVYAHWGEEYDHEHNVRQSDLAHAFIDAGAAMVIGGHPHVVQGIEVYKGKPIFYSLGNLVFDQYFSVDTQEGLGLLFDVQGDSVSVSLLPYTIPASQPNLAEGDQKQKMLNDLASWSQPELKEGIVAGTLSFADLLKK